MNLSFFAPYWAGNPLKKKEQEPLTVGPWEWYFCPAGHSKILKQTPHSCPICTEPMVRVIDTVEIDNKKLLVIKDHETFVPSVIQ